MINKTKSHKNGIIAIDFFCGMGGMTRGLLDAGIKVKKGYDIESNLKDTYEKNNKGAKFICKSVLELTAKEVLEGIDRENNYLLLAGCAPCQPFSNINRKKDKNDKRNYLLLEFGRLIDEIDPDFVLMENVPGLKNGQGKPIFKKFENILKKNKYLFSSDIFDAKDYGVPQRRRRLTLLASKKGEINLPEATHGKNKQDFVTVRDTLKKYPKISAGKKHNKIPNHECRSLSEINKLRLKHIRKNGGSREELPTKLKLKCHDKHSGHGDVYGRMKWDTFAPTLTCKCTSISNGRFGHPTQTRGISLREAAALQTFKDEYKIYGNLTEATRWVGNAVPVMFLKMFAKQIVKHKEMLDYGIYNITKRGNKSF